MSYFFLNIECLICCFKNKVFNICICILIKLNLNIFSKYVLWDE